MKRTVLITGGAGSIGSGLARTFALQGDMVIIHYNNSGSQAKELCKLMRENGCSADIFKADICNDDELEALAAFAVDNDVEVLINNAGISDTRLFSDETNDNIERVINADLTAAIKLTRLVAPHMISKKRGCIINISSIWGECGASCEVVYSAAKAGLIGFTKALAKELAPSGIRVNCITPGVIRSRMLDEHSPETLEELKHAVPLGRLGEASDVASCALFLASSAADYITGEVIRVNGGFCI